MTEKIKNAWYRFNIWYMISGTDDLVDLSFKVAKFLGCYLITGVLIMGGLIHIQEVRNIDPNSPISIILAFVGFYVSLMGAAVVARS